MARLLSPTSKSLAVLRPLQQYASTPHRYFSSAIPSLQKPGYPAPARPPKDSKWDLTKLKEHVQTAVLVELHTIPLYLFSMYAVRPEGRDPVKKLRSVLKQEMLHLSLAGNLLCAIGGNPVLYHQEYTPKYPCEIFYEPIKLQLQPPHKESIKTFIKASLEKPELSPMPYPAPGNPLPDYNSIGAFYQSLIRGLKVLATKPGQNLFDPATASRQFGPEDGIYPDGTDPNDRLVKITDLNSALAALHTIVEQGEGTTGGNSLRGPSHWKIFQELENQAIPYHPTIENPETSKFEGDIKTAMLAFDAAYSYLLLSTEKSWTTTGNDRSKLIGNIDSLMGSILSPIAKFLVAQKLEGRDKYAAPPFNYYEFTNEKPARKHVADTIQAALDKYQGNSRLKSALRAANGLSDLPQSNV
ncbi:unnamed protein product [Rhizoctonia solani]|uniref:Iminophenyl-pyruvate dimer synthase domain-containing protein n=1 Tax=Rhizoctonia solani TaxID=456999 RepID=A0A8H3D642_9AGAM|nr:unnamed protein product [Rhizoctonia solani]